MKKLLLFQMLLMLALQAWSQRTVVSGTVVHAKTNEPVVGASVTMNELSVVTNEDGFFTLKSEGEAETITVSHVGYRLQQVKLTGQPLKIRMQPVTIQLSEVLVMPKDARELVMQAIDKIPGNYSQQTELHHCFYREKAMKRQHYISVAEGVIDMYKTGYQRSMMRDKVAIRKGRRLLSPKQKDTLSVKVLGGPVTSLELDLVKNTEFLLNGEELNHYDLQMEAPTVIGDRQQLVVSLKPRTVLPYPLYFGRLFIDQETLTFTRAELSLDMKDREKATNAMLVKKPAGVRFRPRELSFVVDYRQGADGLMRISYLQTIFRFNCDWKRRLLATSFTAFCEMAVTSTTAEDVQPIKGRESFDQRDAFFDKVDYFRDSDFWQDYNIIEPTESLDKAVLRLLKKY